MSKADRLRVHGYLEHILEAIERIHQYVENIDETGFLGDTRTQDEVIRNIEIIGEACKNIEQHHPEFCCGTFRSAMGRCLRNEERVSARVFQSGLGNRLANDSPRLAAISHAD